MEQPVLAGLKVLDLSQYVAGPFCTKMLAELGAEVIKIERPGGGDGARDLGPFFKDLPGTEASGLFLYLNTGKKSVTLNLKSPTGKKLFAHLLEQADVLVESFRPSVMKRLGFDYQSVEGINPRLVMTSITNYGQNGPYRDYKAADINSFAMGGLMSKVGDPDRPPTKLPGPWSQYSAGVHAFTGTLVALMARDFTGEGQHVDVSIHEVVASHTNSEYLQWAYQRVQNKRTGNTSAFAGGASTIQRTGDGGFVLVATQPWDAFAHLIGHAELLQDPRFANRAERVKHGKELDGYISEYTLARGKEELFREAQAKRVTWAPINTVADLFSSPQLGSRDFFKEIDHPTTGPLPYPGNPVRLGETPTVYERAPLLGEHNEEVLGAVFGYGREDLTRLRETGVI